ncbi:MAG TPA: 3-phosphoshikimate 1-carboxyvinyltransferase, partial [Gudongella oleilytica]|nr:3-phosphoshikimate 1-carboxyvinyltransferase [Gudongella oleilytica]
MKHLSIRPGLLTGSVDVPPSKSIAHRAIIAAALADGYSLVENFIVSRDMEATIEGMRRLGATIKINDEGESLEISGGSKIKSPIEIDCIESGSTLRFLIPIALVKNREA